MPLMQLDNRVVSILRDAAPGDHGFDKRHVGKQVHVLLPDNSTKIVPLADITIDGVKTSVPSPVVAAQKLTVSLAPVPDAKPAEKD